MKPRISTEQAISGFYQHSAASLQVSAGCRGNVLIPVLLERLFSPLIYLENYKNYTIALGLQSFVSQYSSQWMLLMAAATIGVLPAIVVFLIGQKYLLEGIALTGIKG